MTDYTSTTPVSEMKPKQARQMPSALIIACSSLAAGIFACLLYVLWPASSSARKEAKAAPDVAAAVAKDTAAARIPAGSAVSRATTGLTRPAGPELPAVRVQTIRPPQQAKPLVLPNFKPEHIIRGPASGRDGPPVRTPAPGASTAANLPSPPSPPTSPSARAARPARVVTMAPSAAPNGATRNARGQSLPFLPPARRLSSPAPFPPSPAPATAPGTPRTN